MSDSPTNPGGGRPARPAIPPFRPPVAGRPAAPGSPAAPSARPLTPRDRAAVPPAGLPPRPAVSPAVVPGATQRTPARPGTPARPPYATPIAARPANPASSAPTPVLTPLVATPATVVDERADAAANEQPAAVDPLAGLDVIEAAAPASASPTPADTSARGSASAPPTDWLSPEGALRGEFGDLVDEVPQRPTAKAPVFPTPPAPWPAVTTAPAGSASIEENASSEVDDLDLGFEEITGSVARPATEEPARAGQEDVDGSAWTPESSDRSTPVEVTSVPGALDVSAAEAETWADAYGAQADAIHGPVDAEEPAETDAVAGSPQSRTSDWWEAEHSAERALGTPAEGADSEEPATYLASEWPDAPRSPDPSTLPTPVIGSPTIAPGWSSGRVHDVPADPALESARRGDEDFGWDDSPSSPEGAARGASDASGLDQWAFEAAPSADVGKATPTTSSLSAAEALEQIAAQLRAGTLRADGYSPALGEAAALSAVLAALLGVDARWDVR